LLAIFVFTAAVYGATMGSFRLFHDEFHFSDFELSGSDTRRIQGEVAGVSFPDRTVFTRCTDLPLLTSASVRFNLSRPSDAYEVVSIGEMKGYGAMTLAPGSSLRAEETWRLPLLVACKTPLLFIATLLICSMALYVLNLAFGLRLRFVPVMALMSFALAATGVMLCVFAPIVLLFSAVTENYHFMKVLHVLFFAVAGFFGVKVLGEGLNRMANGQGGTRSKALLSAWLLLYCLVGGQLAWTLKPFLGTPYLPATPPFRIDSGNIYVSFFESLWKVVSP
jgi:hypothetical protein